MANTDTLREAEGSIPSVDAVPADGDDALRKRLLSRIAVAGVVIVGLLGGLAVFDSLNRPQAPALPKMAAVPAAPDPVRDMAAPAEKADEEGEDAATEEPEAEEAVLAETEAVPERSETPLAPLPVAKPLTPPATPRSAAIRPSEPAAAPARPDARREIARSVPESTRSPTQAPASRPLTRAAESSAQRFLVQVGVFGNYANAEELLQKLHGAGIPAQIESRVQVGPFASRAEAEAARAKLKALGIDDGLLVRR